MSASIFRGQARVVRNLAFRQSTLSLLVNTPRSSSWALRPFSTTLCWSNESGDAQRPVKTTSTRIPGTPTWMAKTPPSRQLYLGNIHFDATEEDIHELVLPFGEVDSVRLLRNPDGSHRGTGWVVFADQSAADRCLVVGLDLFDRPLRVEYSKANNLRGQPPSRILYVGNLAPGDHEGHVRDVFEPFGAIQRVSVATSRRGEPRGFAHVEFLNEEDAVSAHEQMAVTPPRILDHELRVTYASPRPPLAPQASRRS
ncbi:hypothetical protein R3P38DRAFT_2616113 [Favolaschia claudopus]|uniref:RRM domain-containing protein n=1 Tax=Favolaschia claudopus TaxID=2862362 RepID=A0AAW0CAF7_9AGAR